MPIRTIRTDGDEILRKISKPVKEITPRLAELIDDMINDLHEYNGVGLAAVQVGVLRRICIICIDPEDLGMDSIPQELKDSGYDLHTNGEDVVIINPEWSADNEVEQCGSEGCLSFPGKFGKVTRPMFVTLKALDRNLQPFEIKAAGLLARAICHECDHMDGHLYVDKVEGELETVNDVPEEDVFEEE